MEISTTNAQPQSQIDSQVATARDQSSASLSSDFETFLKMLTVQLENQDPLNPVDSADYAVQLATFSSVEQQVLTNDLLTSLTASMTGGNIGLLGQWVGMDVRAGNAAQFNGDAIELVAPENPAADQRILVVRTEGGEIATRVNISTSGQNLSWDGTLADGAQAETATYRFSIETLKNGTLLSSEDASTYNRVREAVVENGQTKLILDGGIAISPNEVSALRSPG